jgi:glutamate synthase domain-containing protein 3
VAEEARWLLASLGLRSIEEAVGRTDLLRPRGEAGGGPGRLDVSPVLAGRARGVQVLSYGIGNADRAVGARLSGELAREFGAAEPPGRAEVTFRGSAGQSFGAFLSPGLDSRLVGEANDYVGKGMGGGRIVVVPPEDDAGDPVLVGNTVLYGATGGELFAGAGPASGSRCATPGPRPRWR